MKNLNDLLGRLQRVIPEGVKPAFETSDQLMQWQYEQGRQRCATLIRDNQVMKMERAFNRSGIRELYMNCSFDNYHVSHPGQQKALENARQYADNFDGSIASFVFSGKSGTGKNHLAAAICNELLLRDYSVLIITVADMMLAMKDTFNQAADTTEERLIRDLSSVDLLVIDEIGMQFESRYEKVIINQIVDRRSSSKRPTGMLTNLNSQEMTALLGERVMDRMRLGNSLWVTFNWESYRRNITGREI